jgi:O-antigen ligase
LNLERAQLGLLAALAATIPVSIFASQLLLWLSIAVLVGRLAARRARLVRTPLDTPLLALAVWTLLAASFAQDPVHSHETSKKLVLYALFYVGVEVLGRAAGRERVLSSALLGGLALAGLMLAQHLFLGYDRLDRRPSGFLGHYMSASGVTMAVLLLAVARLALGPRARPRLVDLRLPAIVLAAVGAVAAATLAGHGVVATRLCVGALAALAAAVALSDRPAVRAAEAALPLVTAPLAAWALVVSQTRSAWIGAALGLAVIAVLRAPRLLWLLGAAAAAVVLLRPASVTSRLTIVDESSRDRYYMWQAGIDMVLDKPVFGQGPGMILAVYPRYRWPEAPNPRQPHLHNNLFQVAAERGLPGLAFFLWWVVAAFVAALREARRDANEGPDAGWAAGGVLGALAAVFVAGLFEYNLGDSEVLMLFLLLSAVPFALRHARAAAA